MNCLSTRSVCAALLLAAACGGQAFAAPRQGDRVYTADQNTNTVSVIDPVQNVLLGQIKLGNVRPDVLSPLYRGQVNVHGLGFSPDHKTVVTVANGSNSLTFIDTETNAVKATTYIGRSPHEAFFTPDGEEVWAVVRGEDYVSVFDAATFKETARIAVADGPGMVMFTPDNRLAFVVSSFTPEVDVIDVATRRIVKRIPVVSPFSPFLQFTPDFREIWMTHKDVGKVTRIDTATLEVKQVIDTGLITNHLGFAKTSRGTLAYVSVGGENVVKVFSTGHSARLLDTIAVGALPHGIWPSDDGSRMYVGLENGDAVNVIDTESDKVLGQIPVGQAPQALIYVSGAVDKEQDSAKLVSRVNQDSVNVSLRSASGDSTGFIVLRDLGLFDTLEVFLFKLKPQAAYDIFVTGTATPLASFSTNSAGMANGTAIGPLRQIVSGKRAEAGQADSERRFYVVPASFKGDISYAALKSGKL